MREGEIHSGTESGSWTAVVWVPAPLTQHGAE